MSLWKSVWKKTHRVLSFQCLSPSIPASLARNLIDEKIRTTGINPNMGIKERSWELFVEILKFFPISANFVLTRERNSDFSVFRS